MGNIVKILEEALEESKKREKRYRKIQLIPCLLILMCGVFTLTLHFWLSGIVTILISFILYIKICDISKQHTKEFEEFLKSAKDEHKS